VFKTTRAEALVTARRLLRGYASAPEPRRQVQQVYNALLHGQGWAPGQEALILDFGAWLQNHPNLGELKSRCEAVLGKLA
jgi:hypothetical protein